MRTLFFRAKYRMIASAQIYATLIPSTARAYCPVPAFYVDLD